MAEKEEAEDLEQNVFYRFVEDLRVLALDAAQQCAAMGNYNAPWEIRNDVRCGVLIANARIIELTQEQRDGIHNIAASLESLPDEAVTPEGVIMTTNAGCMVGMTHNAWEPLRQEAARLLALLEPAIEQNKKYLYPV